MARYTRNEASTVPQINTELEKIEAAIEDSLSRKGDAPNSMSGPLDMNNQRILNIPEPVDATDPLRKIDGEQYVTAAAASAAQALESEQNAEASATSAAASASSASSDASVAAGLIEDLNAIYLGAFTTGPETDNEGQPLQQGALYYNTVTKNLMVFNGTSWVISVSQALADAAAASAAQAEDSAAAALASEQAADASEQLAEQHKDTALASASSATSSANAASASQTAAAASASDAATSASQSSASATASAASASSAATSETNASNSASAAALSESNASTSEANAAASESAAALSEAAASSSAAASAQSASDASASETAAQQSAVAALASENAAATSATSAAGSATAASASATAAGDSASAALASEQAAATSESNAATSASQAAGSASSASASASAAATSESNAATSETNAAGSATSAASSASAAAGSATSASNSAATALLYLNDTEAARDEVLQYSTAVSKGLVFVGVYDASTGVYPTLPVDVIGNPFWIIQTGGTISGTVYQAGDSLIRDVENSQWIKLDTVDQVSSVAGKVGAVVLDKADVGLSNVDNTSDLNKPISTATQSALDGKANSVHSHSISDVTGLQTALDGKAPLTGSGTSGTWPISVTGNASTVSSITSSQVTTALGYTPYNSTNPSGYINSSYSGFMLRSSSSLTNPNTQFDSSAYRFDPNANNPTNDYYAILTYGNNGNVTGQLATHFQSGQTFTRAYNSSWSSWRTQLDSSNYNSYSPTLTGGNASGTWGISITGNAGTSSTFSTGWTNYKGTTDGSVSGMMMWKQYGNNHVIFDASNSTTPSGASCNNTNSAVAWSGTYPTLMGWNGSTTFGVRVDSARISDITSQRSFSGTLTGEGDIRSPIFYDSNDTGFYVDPNGLSRTSAIAVENRVHITENRFLYMGGTATSEQSWGSRDWTSGGNRYYNARSHTFNNDGYGSTFSFYVGADQANHNSSLRAPIFYDSNNTGYYADPASLSVLNDLLIIGPGGSSRAVARLRSPGNVPNDLWLGSNGSDHWSITSRESTNPFLGFYNAGASNWCMQLDFGGNYASATNSFRAPIFYDSNNTGYYVDPASTSVLYNLRITNALDVGNGSTTHQYLSILNGLSGAGGIKVGGLLCSDSYNFGNPSRNDILAKGNITAYSDGRYKTNIKVIDNAVDKVKQIRGVTYDMTDDSENRRYAGVIAQEVKAVLPEVVLGSEEDRYSVAYGNMVGLLIEAIKEQQTQIEALTSEINTLKEMIK